MCSAVVTGKGGDLKRYFDPAQIPKGKWPSILGSDSLCSAVAGDLIRFLSSMKHRFRKTSGRSFDDKQLLHRHLESQRKHALSWSRAKSRPRREVAAGSAPRSTTRACAQCCVWLIKGHGVEPRPRGCLRSARLDMLVLNVGVGRGEPVKPGWRTTSSPSSSPCCSRPFL